MDARCINKKEWIQFRHLLQVDEGKYKALLRTKRKLNKSIEIT
jgi:hypothetical protein